MPPSLWRRIKNFFGATGSDGPTGNRGYTGYTGTDGSIVGMGPRGETGFQGYTGPTGPHNNFSNDKGVWESGGIYSTGFYVRDVVDNNQYVYIGESGLQSNTPPNSDTAKWVIHSIGGHTGSDYDPGSGGRESELTGPKGPDGKDNVSVVSKGLDGPQGFTGFEGYVGEDGPTGVMGHTGLTGTTGPTGFLIPTIDEWNSATGYVQTNIVRYNGDLYIFNAMDGTSSTVPSQDGNWRVYFDKGTGITGGNVDPSEDAELTQNFKRGDLYYNKETGDLFIYDPPSEFGGFDGFGGI